MNERTAALPPLTRDELLALEDAIRVALDLGRTLYDFMGVDPERMATLDSLRTAVVETRFQLE